MALPKKDGIMAAGPQEDRLSDLPDGVLGHVLSLLSAQEAARAAVLSRRYHHAFASVHTLSFVQEQGSSSTDADGNDYRQNVDKARNEGFIALVDAAISCSRRCSGRDPGLRAFRVAFDSFHHSLAGDVDLWLSAATRGGSAAVEEIHIDARRQEQRACARERSVWYYADSSFGQSVELKDESDGTTRGEWRRGRCSTSARIGSSLEELYVVFPEGKYAVQSMLMGEIKNWVMDRPVKVVFA